MGVGRDRQIKRHASSTSLPLMKSVPYRQDLELNPESSIMAMCELYWVCSLYFYTLASTIIFLKIALWLNSLSGV